MFYLSNPNMPHHLITYLRINTITHNQFYYTYLNPTKLGIYWDVIRCDKMYWILSKMLRQSLTRWCKVLHPIFIEFNLIYIYIYIFCSYCALILICSQSTICQSFSYCQYVWCRLRAASKSQAEGPKKTRTRDRAARAFPAPEANAELSSNLEVCLISCFYQPSSFLFI